MIGKHKLRQLTALVVLPVVFITGFSYEAGATKLVPRAATVSSASSRAQGYELVIQQGWGEQGWRCFDKLVMRESGWNHKAYNRSGAYGIPQALPGRKMASHGSDWRTNPRTQIRWMISYVKGRYRTPCAALAHSYRRNWY